uniref:Uncharacterized protein n=1 Tax=Micrurus spixii TaxID=129469 RepID=A0A2D4M4N4_9SAUR
MDETGPATVLGNIYFAKIIETKSLSTQNNIILTAKFCLGGRKFRTFLFQSQSSGTLVFRFALKCWKLSFQVQISNLNILYILFYNGACEKVMEMKVQIKAEMYI